MINEKKLINELKQSGMIADNEYGNAMVEMIENQTKIGEWIPCSKQLPSEPEELPTEDDYIEEMILDGKFEEYIVTIHGAEEATTLYYIGNGEWYDDVSGECYYKIAAWQPLPEVYTSQHDSQISQCRRRKQQMSRQ